MVEIYKIPENILNNTIKDIISTIHNNNGPFYGLNLQEIIFLVIFSSQGWRVNRLPINKTDYVKKYLVNTIVRDFQIKKDSLSGNGCPDFLLTNYDTKEFIFVEIKFYEKSLTSNQEKWANKYNYDLFVAKLAELDRDDEENKKLNKLIRHGT